MKAYIVPSTFARIHIHIYAYSFAGVQNLRPHPPACDVSYIYTQSKGKTVNCTMTTPRKKNGNSIPSASLAKFLELSRMTNFPPNPILAPACMIRRVSSSICPPLASTSASSQSIESIDRSWRLIHQTRLRRRLTPRWRWRRRPCRGRRAPRGSRRCTASGCRAAATASPSRSSAAG